MKTVIRLWGMAFFALLPMVFACTSDTKQPGNAPASGSSAAQQTAARPAVNVPAFSADSAYAFVQKQVDFGPRVPGTAQHKACAQWLEATLKRFAPNTTTQAATVTAHDGKKLPVYNVIAAFNPQATRRILLCSHWDSRPNADQDTERTNEPILGANDGASGVGILLEIGRLLAANPLPASLGIDIILFDTEDYGDYGIDDSFCLGSQYWSKNLHTPGYRAEYGILLDMVGAPDALFMQEQNSLGYAPDVVKKVWNLGNELGYGSYFINKPTRAPITDDHLYVNQNAKIPTIDIIHYTYEGEFGHFWHTHKDNMNAISKTTLQAVGHTLTTLIYRESANAI